MATSPISSASSNNRVDNQRAAAKRAAERRSPKASERLEQVRAKREERSRSDEAAVLKLSQKSGTAKPAEPAPIQSSQQANPTPSPPPKKIEGSNRKDDSVGSAKLRVVNQAVEGRRDDNGGNKVFLFDSGEGPYRKKVAGPKEKEAVKKDEPKTIDAQA